jgi:hypothetical protein
MKQVAIVAVCLLMIVIGAVGFWLFGPLVGHFSGLGGGGTHGIAIIENVEPSWIEPVRYMLEADDFKGRVIQSNEWLRKDSRMQELFKSAKTSFRVSHSRKEGRGELFLFMRGPQMESEEGRGLAAAVAKAVAQELENHRQIVIRNRVAMLEELRNNLTEDRDEVLMDIRKMILGTSMPPSIFVNGTDLAIFKATFGFSGTPGDGGDPSMSVSRDTRMLEKDLDEDRRVLVEQATKLRTEYVWKRNYYDRLLAADQQGSLLQQVEIHNVIANDPMILALREKTIQLQMEAEMIDQNDSPKAKALGRQIEVLAEQAKERTRSVVQGVMDAKREDVEDISQRLLEVEELLELAEADIREARWQAIKRQSLEAAREDLDQRIRDIERRIQEARFKLETEKIYAH